LESVQEPFKFGQKYLHRYDGLEGSPMKKKRLAMQGAPGHPEHLKPPPGQVKRRQKSLIASPRLRSSPGRCSGSRRRGPVQTKPSSSSSPTPPT
jgi:hypothetical protein